MESLNCANGMYLMTNTESSEKTLWMDGKRGVPADMSVRCDFRFAGFRLHDQFRHRRDPARQSTELPIVEKSVHMSVPRIHGILTFDSTIAPERFRSTMTSIASQHTGIEDTPVFISESQ